MLQSMYNTELCNAWKLTNSKTCFVTWNIGLQKEIRVAKLLTIPVPISLQKLSWASYEAQLLFPNLPFFLKNNKVILKFAKQQNISSAFKTSRVGDCYFSRWRFCKGSSISQSESKFLQKLANHSTGIFWNPEF